MRKDGKFFYLGASLTCKCAKKEEAVARLSEANKCEGNEQCNTVKAKYSGQQLQNPGHTRQ